MMNAIKILPLLILDTVDPQVSLSAFAFIFSELVQYNQNRVTSVSDLEKK